MTPERWQKVKEIFHSALEHEPDQRSAFLSSVCNDDDALRKEVESLIASHEKDGSFISLPAYEAAAGLLVDDETGLKPGQQLGPYEIVSLVGKGGMGQVYLAEDNRLGRKVALKFLSADFVKDPTHLQRFEQEARAASALNQPNILTIHEVGEIDGKRFIATEYIDGETLRQRLLSGSVKVAAALGIAEQVASALSAAHAAGIIHRDIKPENIMLRRDGVVKVLDFGLAKLTKQKTTDPEDSTRAFVKTDAGIVMGTVAYMSPEQARGLNVDARTDIWSLGVVLYEMTSGRPPFIGPTNSDVIVAVLEREPASLLTISGAPEALEWIVTKALTKEREDRYQTARELLKDLRRLKERLAVEAAIGRSGSPDSLHPAREIPPSFQEPQSRSAAVKVPIVNTAEPGRLSTFSSEPIRAGTRRLKIAAAALFLVAATAFGVFKFFNRNPSITANSTATAQTRQVTFSTGLDQFPSLSPEGTSLAYSSDQNGSFEIYVKQLVPGGRDIQLTNDGQQNLEPAWSPDGQHLAYFSKNRGGIWVVPALGGNPKQLVEFGSRPAWSRDGSTIAFQSGAEKFAGQTRALAPSTIWTISAAGGSPRQITQQAKPTGGHSSPVWSPDGKYIAFQTSDYALSASTWEVSVEGERLRKVADFGGDPIYAPDGSEIYVTGARGESGLLRIRLSPTTREPTGEPEVIVATGPGLEMTSPTVSADGKKIAYTVSQSSSSLWSISLSAKSAGAPVPFARDTSRRNTGARFSNDGRKVAITKSRPGTGSDIWLGDADGGDFAQLTSDSANEFNPNWFPQDDRIAFVSDRDGKNKALWSISLATGKEERLLDLGEGAAFAAISPDGKQVAFNSNKSGTINMWITLLGRSEPRQLTFSEKDRTGFPCWSRDGQFLAYLSQHGEHGYLMVMPASGGVPTQLTFEGQSFVYSWSPDGDKLAFAGERNGIWNVYWISRSTKVQKQLTNYVKLNAFVRYPEWSPLGNQIVYEYAETTGNIWLAELK
jgi:eukaryotic-like serine/threonine-protein kinase